MIGLRALLAVICLVAASNIWILHSSARLRANVYTTTVLNGVALSDPMRNDDSANTRLDLHGNEIDDAVGDYRVDYGGDVYERHVPEETFIHLGPPKT